MNHNTNKIVYDIDPSIQGEQRLHLKDYLTKLRLDRTPFSCKHVSFSSCGSLPVNVRRKYWVERLSKLRAIRANVNNSGHGQTLSVTTSTTGTTDAPVSNRTNVNTVGKVTATSNTTEVSKTNQLNFSNPETPTEKASAKARVPQTCKHQMARWRCESCRWIQPRCPHKSYTYSCRKCYYERAETNGAVLNARTRPIAAKPAKLSVDPTVDPTVDPASISIINSTFNFRLNPTDDSPNTSGIPSKPVIAEPVPRTSVPRTSGPRTSAAPSAEFVKVIKAAKRTKRTHGTKLNWPTFTPSGSSDTAKHEAAIRQKTMKWKVGQSATSEVTTFHANGTVTNQAMSNVSTVSTVSEWKM